jgi:putative FmdB family regulatory protein
MPIYAYRCQDCGFEKDQLQKISDPPLTECPSCGGQGFARILTAPAFQLKGSGWYVTDFRDQGAKGRKPSETAGADSGDGGSKPPAAAEGGAAAGSKTDSPAQSAAPAAGGSGSAGSAGGAAPTSSGSSSVPT